MEKIRVMFLCTGNSCRSQMAEGWTRQLASDWIEVRSAGIEAHGQNMLAIRVMSEVGIDISSQESIRVNAEMLEWADVLVTLCDNAEEQCPVPSAHTSRLHLPLSDPAKIRGDEATLLTEFRQCRDRVRQRVEYVLQQLEGKLSVNGR
ncbi:arsenate reductase ArsC [Methylophaga lonarensis]|nr:arsenate reductase ArsC [Methylophaga lonarensis]